MVTIRLLLGGQVPLHLLVLELFLMVGVVVVALTGLVGKRETTAAREAGVGKD